MKTMLAVLAATAALAAAPAAAQTVTYLGTLQPGVPVTGSVPGFGWGDNTGAEVDFWRFDGTAGQSVTIQANRLDLELDPAFSLYSGTTTANRSQFSSLSDWGGLTFLTYADDEIPVPGSPFTGDPRLTNYLLPATGAYTIALGGYLSEDEGPYDYRLVLVPEPSTWLLLLAGFGGLALVRRRSMAGR